MVVMGTATAMVMVIMDMVVTNMATATPTTARERPLMVK